MSESSAGSYCPGCSRIIVFGDYHIKHCPNPKGNKIIAALQAKKGK